MGISRGEALVNFAQALRDSQDDINNQLFKAKRTQRRIQNKSGLWRALLGGGAFLGATALGLAPLGVAALTGLFSRVGNEVGERSARGPRKIKADVLFGKTKIRDINRGLSQFYNDFNAMQNINMLTDALSAYTATKTFSNLGGELRSTGSSLIGKLRGLSNLPNPLPGINVPTTGAGTGQSIYRLLNEMRV